MHKIIWKKSSQDKDNNEVLTNNEMSKKMKIIMNLILIVTSQGQR